MITICWLLCVFLCNVVYSMENPHHEITTVSAETCRAELVMPWRQKPNNILAIDGGGVRGFVAAMILEKIEETMGKPIHEIFDLICGTSTGGLIALAAGMNKISMKEIKELYRTQSKDLFTMYGAWEMVSKGMYDPAGMERLVQRLGGNKTMDPANKGGTNVCVVASFFDKVSSPKPFVIKNYMWEDTVSTQPWLCNTTAAEAAYCTSAAPMIFPPRVKYNSNFLYDGGLVANNPTSIAIEEVMGSAPVGTVVSIGTGSAPPRESYTTPLSAITSTVAADSARVHEQVARRASTAHLHENTKWMKYFRLNPELAKEFDLTDADEESFASMEKSVHEFLETAMIDASAGSILAKPVVRPGPLTDRTSLLYKALEGEAYVLEDSKQTPDS